MKFKEVLKRIIVAMSNIFSLLYVIWTICKIGYIVLFIGLANYYINDFTIIYGILLLLSILQIKNNFIGILVYTGFNDELDDKKNDDR